MENVNLPKNSNSKAPSFQFYHRDWLGSRKVRSLRPSQRAIYFDLLCFMQDCDIPGTLSEKGKPISLYSFSKLTQNRYESVTKCVTKLVSEHVIEVVIERVVNTDSNMDPFYGIEKGVIYSPRMFHDNRIRKLRRDSGKLGGSPVLLKQKVKQKVNQKVKQNPTPTPTPASTSSFTPPHNLTEGGEEEKNLKALSGNLRAWLATLPAVNSPKGLAKHFLTKYGHRACYKTLADQNCVSLSKFNQFAAYYQDNP